MSYYFSKKTSGPIDDVMTKVGDDLRKEGFGILGETLVSEPDVEVRKYRILGECSPPPDPDTGIADTVPGVELSCYVIAQELPGGTVKVAAIDPGYPSPAIDDPIPSLTAEQFRQKLYLVIANI